MRADTPPIPQHGLQKKISAPIKKKLIKKVTDLRVKDGNPEKSTINKNLEQSRYKENLNQSSKV